MATLKDVAQETGLTVSTVSRVLNNRGYISEAARDKVYAAMKKLDYQPNELARSLSKQATNMIGVIVPHIEHPYFSRLLNSLERAARKKQHKILLWNSQDKQEKMEEYLALCKSNQVTGIVLCSGTVRIGKQKRLSVPLVTIETYPEYGLTSVACDNKQGGRLAAEHLWKCGCRKVVYFGSVEGVSMAADLRLQGFVEVCIDKGMKYWEMKTTPSMYRTLNYYDGIRKIYDSFPEADGIFAGSDLIAAQVIQVSHSLGIKIPEQVKLIGYDDENIASLTTPEITTIRQPVEEMAETAVALLIKGALEGEAVMLPVELVIRESTSL